MQENSGGNGSSAAFDDFGTTLDSLSQAYLVVDGTWTLLYANPAAGRLWGFDAATAIGRCLSDLSPDFVVSNTRACCASVLRGGRPATFEVRIRSAGDAAYSIHVDPVPAGVSILAVDESGRYRAQQVARRLIADFAATLQALPDLLFELDLNGTYIDIWASNPALLASQREMLLGRTVFQALPAAAAESVMAALAEAHADGRSFGQHIRLELADGTHWFELSTARKNAHGSGTPTFMLLSRDVTERKATEGKLEKMRLAFENAQWGIAVCDAEAVFETVNPAFARMHGYDTDELVGRSSLVVVPEHLRANAQGKAATHRKPGHACYETEHRHRDGRAFPVRAEVTTVGGPDGSMAYRIVNVQDLSELRESHDAMRMSDELFSSFFDHSPIGIAIADLDGRYTRVNRAMCEFVGYSAEELLRLSWRDITHPDDVAENDRKRCALISGASGSFSMEKRYLRKDGSTVWSLMVVSMIRDQLGVIRFTLGQMLDIDSLKRKEADLLRSREQLRALAAHQEGLIEGERTRIATEIHDHLGQLLTALKLEAGLMRIQHADNPDIQECCRRMHGLIEETIASVRTIAVELHPPEIDMGLKTAILSLARDFERRYGIACEVRCPDRAFSPPVPVAATIYRVVQESLTNVARHAGASRVQVSGTIVDDAVVVEIIDDGIGFDVAAAFDGESYGLFGMQERVRSIGGELLIDSRPSAGTRLALRLPWNEHD